MIKRREGMASRGQAASAPPASTVCVTGATGYIGSWLVRSLLHRGYIVHATARDTGKASQILSRFGRSDRLKIFRADLREEGSFDEAVEGCAGVFHVAAFMELGTSVAENIEDHVRSKILEPAVRGTINLLRSCSRSSTVKRVIFTSSVSTITAKNDDGAWAPMVDESSFVSVDRVWKEKPNGWVYVLMKRLTEEKAFEFAKEKGMDLVSIISPTVAGPFLTPSVPISNQVILSPLTGDPELYPILVAVQSRLGSIALAHIEDICDAHIFLLETAAARGRYICAAGSCTIPQLSYFFSLQHPSFASDQIQMSEDIEGFTCSACSVICSRKITDLGFEFKYSVKDILKETLSSCAESRFLSDFKT
ncbi:dihydroflavonol 4-reductase [Iris pallida]|uniref:Dihydroflavonol 4-reductase n=1 Tax=Iris pallida TaxID=29817 RepID=A0AAX6ESN3_IRIPA|nr:dihydroflavonol 4-reductase [Iris pallida]